MSKSPKNDYIVLARRYRPQSFASLKGQDFVVRTLSNAIKFDRVAHAFLLNGIRGVGKTTSARIIAKTLNCLAPQMKETVEACGKCENCIAISQGKHPDIIEIDAASKTGVNDIRELIENSNYMPIMAQFKIYIIDEVHMLSTNAFNALLKTLEEPPAHVKFIFATTEIRKIPITILSRCQRFDLRRLSIEEITDHLKWILSQENITAEDEALKMIAQASEGSVRDSLSLLDQAISNLHEEKIITSQLITDMMNLSDRSSLYSLFEDTIYGRTQEAIDKLQAIYLSGTDPAILISDLLEISHIITKVKLVKNSGFGIAPESEILKAKELAEKLSVPSLTRIWQMLLKGLKEVQVAPNPLSSAEMALIRICHVADMPTPGEIIKQIRDGGIKEEPKRDVTTVPSNISATPTSTPIIEKAEEPTAPKEEVKIDSFRDLVQLFYNHREMIIYHHLFEDIHLVKFESRVLKFRQEPNVPHNLANQISRYLTEWTGVRWIVTLSSEEGEATLQEQKTDKTQQVKEELSQHELVQEVMKAFPETKVTKVIAKELVDA